MILPQCVMSIWTRINWFRMGLIRRVLLWRWWIFWFLKFLEQLSAYSVNVIQLSQLLWWWPPESGHIASSRCLIAQSIFWVTFDVGIATAAVYFRQTICCLLQHTVRKCEVVVFHEMVLPTLTLRSCDCRWEAPEENNWLYFRLVFFRHRHVVTSLCEVNWDDHFSYLDSLRGRRKEQL
jgi:hypothetical protein